MWPTWYSIAGAVLALVCLFGLAIRLSLSFGNIERILPFVADDLYYYLTIANSIADGRGPTFDGLSLTNGFHPLYVLILVPITHLSPLDINAPVRAALVVNSVIDVGTAVIVADTVRRIRSGVAGQMAAIMWLLNPFVISVVLTGVEAALAAFLVSVTLWQYVRMGGRTASGYADWLVLGILCGLAILARTDTIFLSAALFIVQVGSAVSSKQRVTFFTSQLLPFGAAQALLIAPWVTWNILTFGTIVQTSGQSISFMQWTAASSILPAGLMSIGGLSNAATMFLTWFVTLANSWLSTQLALPITVIGLGTLVATSSKTRLGDYFRLFALPSTLYIVAVSVAYSLYMPLSRQLWYYLPTLVPFVLVGSLGLLWIVDRWIGTVSPKMASLCLVALTVGILASHVDQGLALWRNGTFAHQTEMYRTALWLQENTPEGARIGVFNAGIYGYYSGRTTVNLDGVVNNRIQSYRTPGGFARYATEMKLDYLVDYERSFADYKPFLEGITVEEIAKFAGTWEHSSIVVYRVVSTG